MRNLSRSEFDRFSTCLLNLYALRDDDVRVPQTLATLDRLIHGAEHEVSHSDSRSLDVQKSGVLRPHLLRALKRVRSVLRLFQEATVLETTLEAIGLATIRIDAKGQILDTDTRATKLLSHYCPIGGGLRCRWSGSPRTVQEDIPPTMRAIFRE